MSTAGAVPGDSTLEQYGLHDHGELHWSLPAAMLTEHIACQGSGLLTENGAVVVSTGRYTGRSPQDKFIVRHGSSADQIWWGKVNQPFEPANFDGLRQAMFDYWQGSDLYVQDLEAAAQVDARLPLRLVTDSAWHALFARNLFLPPNGNGRGPAVTILHAPYFEADPAKFGTHSGAFILLDLEDGMVLIGGTQYAGEIKKSIFTILNYQLPQSGVLSMHCSANRGPAGDVALFFGLSGTGKTTLSSDLTRSLIGDDEHGWGDEGVFNFEGGCYAKTIRLSAENEPIIWQATEQFGTVLENVVMDQATREVDFDDSRLTENTRAGYSLEAVANVVPGGAAGHPQNVFFLSADAFGVLPPISKLSPQQAMYYFLSGYTSKLGGTEKGLGKEPQATFSSCFAEPFLPLHPTQYARLLGDRIERHGANVWLLNTGWTGGSYGVGQRIPLPHTRAMVSAALSGELDQIPTEPDPLFGLQVPARCPEVPADLLHPRRTWADAEAYDQAARQLAGRFVANFEQYADSVDPSVVQAGPALSVS